MIRKWSPEEPGAKGLKVGADRLLIGFTITGKTVGKFLDIEFFNNQVGELGVSFDVLEIDAEIVGGVTEAICAQIVREEFAGFFFNIDSGGGFDGGDVFRSSEAAGEFFWIGEEEVGSRVNVFAAPDRASLDPFTKVCFFLR